MKKNIVRVTIGTLLLGQGVAIDARTISTPPILYTGYPAGHVHYPLDRDREINNCADLDVIAWGAGYIRDSTNAYGPSSNNKNNNCGDTNNCSSSSSNNCDSNSNSCSTKNSCDTFTNCSKSNIGPNNPVTVCAPSSSSKIPVSQLIFGSSTFALAQSFAGASVGTSIPNNPFVAASRLSPVYEIGEKGVFFGLIVGKRFERCDSTWNVGVRFALPYRDINVDDSCSDLVGETLGDLFRTRQETNQENLSNPALINQAWAARLDFLSALNLVAINEFGNPVPLVVYSDPNSAGQITVGTQPLPDGLPASGTPSNTTPSSQPYIDVIRTSDGSAPESVRWADVATNGPTVVSADGSGLANLQRGRFASDFNYTPLEANGANQAQLWLVPNLTSFNSISLSANSVLASIEASIGDIAPSVTNFLAANGINFCAGRSKGLGDLDMEWYVGHQRCDNAWGELQFGVRFPTADKLTDARFLARQPLGNNGHVELRPGLVLGCEYFDWVKFKLDVTYSFVLKKVELLPAPFTGATVANIGPNVPGQVSWQYFLGEFDITFVNPNNPCLGVTVAYQPYVKLADKVCFNCTVAKDFLGNLQTIDPAILSANTKRVAHTIRTEIFFDSPCCNIYGGFAQVVAGSNITRDMDIYLGLQADF